MFVGATSNLKPSLQLQEAWAAARVDPSVRCLQIHVKGEALELAQQTLPRHGSAQQDFDTRIKGELLTPTDSCFLLFALDGPGEAAAGVGTAAPPSWVLVSYIPVGTAVRSKMLYSSSLQGLKQALGPFAGVYSSDEEASYEALLEKACISSSSTGGGSSSGRVSAVSQRLRSLQQWGGGGGSGGGGAAAGNVEEDAPLTELEKVRFRWILRVLSQQ